MTSFRPGPIACVLVLLCAFVFAQVHAHSFITLDDPVWITENPKLAAGLSPATLWAVIAEPHEANWIPLTHLSLLVTQTLMGPQPAGFLLTNVALHALATLALFFALAHMTGALGRSAFVAAVFAVHPLHVEAVAWAAERKDVVAGLCFGLTLLAYARFAERPASGGRYALVLVLLACGLLSKPTIVTLPLVLLLLDFWPLGRLRAASPQGVRRVLLEKLPMLALVAIACVTTLLAQRAGGAMEYSERVLTLGMRLWNALDSYGVYLGQAFWPQGLCFYYPHLPDAVPRGRALLAAGVLVALSAGAFTQRRQRPYFLVGWLWFVITLVPMIGIVQVGSQAHADRYMYLPLQGLAIALAWGAVDLVGSSRGRRRVLAGVALLSIVLLAVAARRQTATWRDSETLFAHAVALDPSNLLAKERLAAAFWKEGRLEEAQALYEDVIRRQPRWAIPRLGLASVLEQRGTLREAMQAYQDGLRLDPTVPVAHMSLARVLLKLGRFEEALVALERERALGSDTAEIHALLASAAQVLGREEEAIRANRAALERDPALLSAANNLAWALATTREPRLRDPEEAVRIAEAAVAKLPEPDPGFLDTLAVSYAAAGRFDDALRTAERAASLAEERGDGATASEIRSRMGLFRARRAWPPPAPEQG